MPKVSIIVPVYKAETYLHRCVDSLLAQTFTDFEILLIDDGSPDRSGEICEEYAAKDPRIRVFHKENGGVSSARNLGLDNACGEWIAFADADDELYSDALQTLMNEAIEDVEMVMAGYEIYSEDGHISYMIGERSIQILSNEEALTQMYSPQPYRYQGYLWNKLFLRSRIEEHRIRFENKIYYNEDRLFITQYLCRTRCKVSVNTKPVYKYIERQGGAMASLKISYNRKFVTDFDAYTLMFEEITQVSDDSGLRKLAINGVIKSYVTNVGLMIRFKDYDAQACQHMKRGMRLCGAYSYYIKQQIRDLLLLLWPSFLVNHS